MGIGRAVAERLIADGIHVVALDLNAEALAEARAELGDLFEPVVGDVGDWDAHERAERGESCRARLPAGDASRPA
jgi:NADP-dependent 3-hydroxy acid dehydrogenase YdfG